MTNKEVQSIIQNNIMVLIEEQKTDVFSSNRNDRFKSYKTRHLLFLNVLLLNPGCTLDVIYPLYDMFDTADSEEFREYKTNEKWERMRLALHNLSKTRSSQNSESGSVIEVEENAYKGFEKVIFITKEGIDYLVELNEFLILPMGYVALSKEDYLLAFSLTKKRGGDHGIESAQVLSLTAANSRYKLVCPIEKEAQKDVNFGTLQALRSEGRPGSVISPDVSFSYVSQNEYEDRMSMPIMPVMLEVDLDNERIGSGVSGVGEKVRKLLSYSDNMSSEMSGPLPSSTVYVISENKGQAKKGRAAAGRVDGYFTADERGFLKTGKFEKDVLEAYSDGAFRSDGDYRDIPVTTIIDGALSQDVISKMHRTDKQKKKLLNELETIRDIADTYMKNTGKELTLRDYPYISTLARYEVGDYYDALLDGRLMPKARVKSEQILGYLREKENRMDKYFLDAHSLSVIPYSRYVDYMKSLHPYCFGVREVIGVFKWLRIAPRWDAFYPVLPLLTSPDFRYEVRMRNCFLCGDTRVIFEDISADLSALIRIKNYITMPSQLCPKTVLVIIIDDDEIISGNRALDHVTYARGVYDCDVDGSSTYFDKFTLAYNIKRPVPLCRATHDFMFLRRSEFLSRDPKKMHPFVKIGMTDVERTPYGDVQPLSYLEGEPYHMCDTETKEFRSFSVKKKVKRVQK